MFVSCMHVHTQTQTHRHTRLGSYVELYMRILACIYTHTDKFSCIKLLCLTHIHEYIHVHAYIHASLNHHSSALQVLCIYTHVYVCMYVRKYTQVNTDRSCSACSCRVSSIATLPCTHTYTHVIYIYMYVSCVRMHTHT